MTFKYNNNNNKTNSNLLLNIEIRRGKGTATDISLPKRKKKFMFYFNKSTVGLKGYTYGLTYVLGKLVFSVNVFLLILCSEILTNIFFFFFGKLQYVHWLVFGIQVFHFVISLCIEKEM